MLLCSTAYNECTTFVQHPLYLTKRLCALYCIPIELLLTCSHPIRKSTETWHSGAITGSFMPIPGKKYPNIQFISQWFNTLLTILTVCHFHNATHNAVKRQTNTSDKIFLRSNLPTVSCMPACLPASTVQPTIQLPS